MKPNRHSRAPANGAPALAPNGGSLSPQPQPTQMQVNPVDAAQSALMFMSRADHKVSERQSFDLAAAMLNAIATGQVVLAPGGQPQPVPVPVDPAQAPPPVA